MSAPGTSTPSAPMLTVDEVAALLRVNRMTVYRMIRTGELPAFRFGRTLRVNSSELADFMTRSRVSS